MIAEFLGSESSYAVREYKRDIFKLNVLCALSRHEMTGPIFFHSKETHEHTNFLDMLDLLAVPEMADLQRNLLLQ
jgi:hypothetical protein